MHCGYCDSQQLFLRFVLVLVLVYLVHLSLLLLRSCIFDLHFNAFCLCCVHMLCI